MMYSKKYYDILLFSLLMTNTILVSFDVFGAAGNSWFALFNVMSLMGMILFCIKAYPPKIK